MTRVNLTEARIKALADGRDLRDAVVPSLIVRSGAKRKVYALHTRFPGAPNPTRRVIAEVGAVTLDGARDTARRWLELIRQGVDPQQEAHRRAEEVRRAVELQHSKQQSLFAAVAEDYLRRKVAGQRQARAVGRIVRNVLIPAWGDKSVADITRRDVVRLVEQIDDERGAPMYAQAAFGTARTLFNWVINRQIYDLDTSPCDRIRVSELTSRRKQPRQRVLSDDELRAFWKATGRMPYPWQQLLRMILLTGGRKTEVAGARWCEIDLERRVWTVPPERFKSETSHLVPLTDDLFAMISELPRFKQGDYLFTFSYGRTPALILHQAKLKLDALMLRYLRALARMRDDDPSQLTLAPWGAHDLRRTMRTRLAGLEVNDTTAEMVIGHAKRGLQRVYDQHSYLPQMKRALEQWAVELKRIVTVPRTNNVVRLRGQGA